MKKSAVAKDTYKLNNLTTVTVTNKRSVDADDGSVKYTATVTLRSKVVDLNVVKFEDSLEIAEFIKNLDFEDEQTALDLGKSSE